MHRWQAAASRLLFASLFVIICGYPGNIVIDGVVASSYNTMLGSEANMHAVTAAGRILYRIAPSLFRYVHAKRLAEPVSLAIGSAASKVCRAFCFNMYTLQTVLVPARPSSSSQLSCTLCREPLVHVCRCCS